VHTRYAERLGAPWWAWLGGLAVALLLAAEVHLGYPGLRAWVPYAVAVPVAVAVLRWAGNVRVAVVERAGVTELEVDDAHVPVSLFSSAEVLRGPAKQAALGRDLHPLAFVIHRPWVPSLVRLALDDPADPTPYWLISTQRPHRLVAALGLTPPAHSPGAEQHSARQTGQAAHSRQTG